METEEKRNILHEFLERWPESAVKTMALSDYVSVGDKDTFTYWVETRTRPLGSIHGWDSIKFGIYRRSRPEKLNQNHKNDSEYTWMARFGNNRKEVFEAVKQDILNIIKAATSGNFAVIDNLQLPNLFKWKVASLYSNERIVPIFKQAVLLKIAAAYRLKADWNTKLSVIHELLINNKPAGQDIYSYMEGLYKIYGSDKDKERMSSPAPGNSLAPKPPRTRKPSTTKNTAPQVRSGTGSYIARQKHNELQEALKQKLIEKHGKDAVSMEENWVDVRLVLKNEIVFYEVKSASYASDCIEQALGQVLGYIFNDRDTRKKRIVVVGPYPPNESDKNFIAYIKSLLNIEFDYQSLSSV